MIPPCWNQSISRRYDGGTPEWCAPRMRATSPDRSWYRPSPTRLRLTLRFKTRKQAWVSGEPRMEEHSLCQISPKRALRWTRSCEPSLSPRKHIAVKVERPASSHRPLGPRKREGGGGASAGSRTTHARTGSVLTHQNDGRLGSATESTSDRFTVSNSPPIPPPLLPCPAHTLAKLWLTGEARNERASWKIWRKLRVLIGWDVWDEAGQWNKLSRQKKTRCHLHTELLVYQDNDQLSTESKLYWN